MCITAIYLVINDNNSLLAIITMWITRPISVENMFISYNPFYLTHKPFVTTLDSIKHEVL